MSDHAKFAPSAAHRWMRCPGSIAAEAALTSPGGTIGPSAYAVEGSEAHVIAAAYLSRTSDDAPLTEDFYINAKGEIAGKREMGQAILTYTDAVMKAADGKHVLAVEQQVDFGTPLGIPDQFGTIDAVIVSDEVIEIHDLKYGMGVKVDARDNEQLMLYAIGAAHTFSYLGPFERFKLVIHQPRLNHLSEHEMTADELERFRIEAKVHMDDIEDGDRELRPGEKQCRFCKAKATCPALAALVQETVGARFENLDEVKADARDMGNNRIADALANVDLIEAWCKAIREHAFEELNAGRDIPGYKLVAGKRGSRKWTSDGDAIATLKSMRLKVDEMYDLSVISPTTAEKLKKKGVIGDKQWARLQTIITQDDGKPHVAPLSDKRPAIATVVDKFPLLA